MSEPFREPTTYRLRRPGGEVDPKRVINAPGIVVAIAAVNILVFILMIIAPAQAISIIEIVAGFSPRVFFAGADANSGVLSMLSPLIAHMFVHASLMHILFNLLWMLAFGAPVARRMGADGALQSLSALAAASIFLTFYLLCGVAGALTFAFLNADSIAILVGASGGVSGLLGGLVRFAFNRSTLFGPEEAKMSPLISRPVIIWSFVITLMNIAVAVFGGVLTGGAEIAWEAHLGGYFFGLLTYPAFERMSRAFG